MSLKPEVGKALESHPCYSEDAHRSFARMHLPVAPRCNIQCNFCNRKYDCSNESRPGVTSEVLSPQQAVEKVAYVKERIPNLSVIGIAGPGDPMANEETFETLKLVRNRFPELHLCISTNGLMLPDNVKRLYDLGVRFVTVTMNAPDSETGAKIYDSVVYGGVRYTGEEGALILLNRQTEGIRMCADLGMAVKVNVVMIPGINTNEIPRLVKKVKSLGAYIVNILPLIPVEGTKFAHLRAPTPEERKEMMDRCEVDARMMRHCRQCRADAIGMLDNDRSQEFVFSGCGGGGCFTTVPITPVRKEKRIAVATDGKGNICGFGTAKTFEIYERKGGEARFVESVTVNGALPVAGSSHKQHILSIIEGIGDCSTVAVSEIGEMPSHMLTDAGISIIRLTGTVRDGVRKIIRCCGCQSFRTRYC